MAQEISYSPLKTQFIASFAGDVATYDYWCRPLPAEKLQVERVKTLESFSYDIFIEISPQPTLLSPNTGGKFMSSLRPEIDSYSQMLACLGELYLQGIAVNWSGFDEDSTRRLVVLPTYPFQRQRYWFESNINRLLAKARLVRLGLKP